MPNTTRSIVLAAIAGATLLANAMPASAFVRGGGLSGGAHFGGAHFGGAHFGTGHFAGGGRPVVHGGGLHLATGRPGGPIRGVPGPGHRPPRWPIYGWHPHHHFPIYGGPIIPVAVATGAVATGAVIATAPAVTGVAAPAPACAVPAGSFVTITFLPAVTAAEITTFLQSYNVTLADGPDKDGVYKIRLADQILPPARIAEVIASMRGQATIVKSIEG